MTKTEWTLDKIRDAKKPNVETRLIPLDPEWAKQFEVQSERRERALRAVRAAKSKVTREPAQAELDEADEELEELESRRESSVIEFRLAGLNPHVYEEVVQANQPSAKQRREFSERGDTLMWNPDTFPSALVAACLLDPKLTAEEVAELEQFENWLAADSQSLFEGAMSACTRQFKLV